MSRSISGAARAALLAVSGVLAVGAVIGAFPSASSATPGGSPEPTTSSTPSSGGGPGLGIGGLSVPVIVSGVGKTVNHTVKTVGTVAGGVVGGLTAPRPSTTHTGGTSTPTRGHGTHGKPASHPHPVHRRTHHRSTPTTSATHPVHHRAAAHRTHRRPRPAGTSAHRASHQVLSASHARIGEPLTAQHRIVALAEQALEPIGRPDQTLMMLLGSTTALAILVLSLLIFVGRRPDPRVAASAHRLRSSASF